MRRSVSRNQEQALVGRLQVSPVESRGGRSQCWASHLPSKPPFAGGFATGGFRPVNLIASARGGLSRKRFYAFRSSRPSMSMSMDAAVPAASTPR